MISICIYLSGFDRDGGRHHAGLIRPKIRPALPRCLFTPSRPSHTHALTHSHIHVYTGTFAMCHESSGSYVVLAGKLNCLLSSLGLIWTFLYFASSRVPLSLSRSILSTVSLTCLCCCEQLNGCFRLIHTLRLDVRVGPLRLRRTSRGRIGLFALVRKFLTVYFSFATMYEVYDL